MDTITVGIKRLSNYLFEDLPQQASPGAAGIDCRACIEKTITLSNLGDMVKIPLGFVVEIPEGFEGQLRPRSGLAAKHGVSVINSPGTVDCDYRGEVQAMLVKTANAAILSDGSTSLLEPLTIEPGDRICQLVFAPVPSVRLQEKQELSETSRASKGFGSTGVK